jgi:2-succinyl-6-hydroxy-2,4-cyclohexadiene-1-carboxylate synthase
MASDVWGVMQQMDLQKAHFVGSSMGAEVALSMAANHPEKVLSLALEGALVSQLGPYSEFQTSPKKTKAVIEAKSLAVKEKSGVSFATIDELLDRKKTNAPTWNQYVEAAERYGAHRLADGRYGATMGIKQWLSYIKHSVPIRFEEYFKDVECPVLLFSGTAEFSSEETVSLQRTLLDLSTPKGTLLLLDNWSHPVSWLANPEEGITAVKSFLATARQK